MTALLLALGAAVGAVLLWPGPSGEGTGRAAARTRWLRSVRPYGPARPEPPGVAWAADLADLAALGLEAGLPPEAAAHLARGLVGEAGRPAGSEVAFLSAAWSLADELGAPAAGVARGCAVVLRERAAAHGRRRALEAGPRASRWLLTLLPLGGPVAGLVLGLPVGELYARPTALGSVAIGGCLTGVGWLWSGALVRRASRPAELTG